MNDYSFGNYILMLRSRAGLSQSALAALLGVTNKAVSKWEVGKAKPGVEMIRKLAAVFQVSVDELLKRREEEAPAEIVKIVVTGGPCAGKTTAMSWIQNAFTQMGYVVLFVPETVTELIDGGVAPWTCRSNAAFQRCQLHLQLEKENVFMQAAQAMDAAKVLIVCDRGALDNKAYMDRLEFAALLEEFGTNEVDLRDHYDAVFHLVTAAKGAEAFYSTANNTARTETAEEAAALDDKLISAWTGHPHLRVIDNSSGFEEKMKRLIAEISSFLGEPEPFEIERKFLIEYPDLKWLESIPNCRRIEIIQTYLKSDEDEEVRVRQRGSQGHYVYFQTTKRKVSDLKRVEIERRLTESEYLRLLMNADTTKRQIRKTRYCLTYENQYFEIDVYPFWNDQAIAEIELSDENADVRFPKQIKVIKEVTDDESYKNASLAKIK
ncbi:MAG: AAA family ATPase [Clostridia bacterium]|nr:AAA family ATPase [Clostridia bacterium]